MNAIGDPDGAGRRLPVRARVWGKTESDADRALAEAKHGTGRTGWAFGEPERLVGGACPFDVRDRTALAAHAGYGWAYTVHRAAP